MAIGNYVSSQTPEKEAAQSEVAMIKRWVSRFEKAKKKWEPDFERMRENMEFVTGIQHEGQTAMRDDQGRYVANMTLRMVAQKVAQLYARNPKVEAVRRKRLDFALWDGEVESLQDAFQGMMQGRMMGIPNMEAEATMQDFMQGKREQKMVERICRTLEIVDQYDIDNGQPDFKEQMKQLVRRVVTCGVAYARPIFIRENGSVEPSTIGANHKVVDRAKMLQAIASKLVEGDLDENDPEVETLKSLALSIGVSTQKDNDYQLEERVEHDFLPATSVIPDEKCRHLKGFIAARWVFIEYNLPASEVNEMFGLEGDDEVEAGSNVEDDSGKHLPLESEEESDEKKSGSVCLIEVLDITTHTRCFIVKGHKKFVQPAAPLDPCYPGFWPLVSLTFNDVEVDDTCERASIFPPSDVDLIRDPQKEWNRSREANRDQRNANAPGLVTRKGALSEEDRRKLKERVPNEVIELEQCPSDQEPSQVLQPIVHPPFDEHLYDTSALEQDFLLAGGMQQANIGPAQPDVTATVGTIAEQSRMTVASSNIDDLDGMLSSLARIRGHLRLQSMSAEVVIRIAGRGAAWPTLTMSEYLNQIVLTIVAASSGRPNRALDIANFERVAPILLQAGANPIAVIEEAVRRLGDDRMDVTKFYPLPGMGIAEPAPGAPQEGGRSMQGARPVASMTNGATPSQPLQPMMSGVAMPLSAG